MKQALGQVTVASVMGLLGAAIFSLVVDAETVGGIVLVVTPLFLTSVGLVLLVRTISTSRAAQHAAFVSPVLFVLGMAGYVLWVDVQSQATTGVSDGGADMALYFFQAYLSGLAVAYICLIVLERRRVDRAAGK